MIGVIGIAARIAGPHIPFCLSLGHPFSKHFARAAPLGDAKGKDTGLKGIGHTRHGPDEGQAIRCIGNRAIDDLGHAPFAKDWHTRQSVFDIPFQPVQIIGIKLKTEIIGQGVIRRGPMRAAIALIRAEVKAVFFLAQIIRAVHIAQERQFMARIR